MAFAATTRNTVTPLDGLELEELVRRCRDGDLDAFNRIVDHFYDVIYRLAYRILCDRDAAEDATQEIFLKAWQRVGQFRGASRFTTWLHTVAVNHCLDASRRRSRQQARTHPPFSSEAFEDLPHQGPVSSLSEEDRLVLRESLEKLSEKLRIVVTLRYYAEYSVADIAATLDLPHNTVRSRLALAMIRLRRDLADLEER